MALIDKISNYWKLDTNNSTQPDSHGSNDGAVTGALYTAGGKINGGYDFNNNADQIEVSQLFSSSDWTIALWEKLEINNGITTTSLFSQNGSAFVLYGKTTFGTAAGKMRLYTSGEILVSTIDIEDGDWHHIVLTKSGSTCTLYIDGAFDASGTFIYSLPIAVTDFGTRGGLYHHDGILDEIAFFDGEVLTTDEISELYNSGDGLQYPFSPAGGLLRGAGMDGLNGRYFSNQMAGGMAA